MLKLSRNNTKGMGLGLGDYITATGRIRAGAFGGALQITSSNIWISSSETSVHSIASVPGGYQVSFEGSGRAWTAGQGQAQQGGGLGVERNTPCTPPPP